MLQNQGWSEGEGLGASLSGNDASIKTKRDKMRKRKRTGLDRHHSSLASREEPTIVTEEQVQIQVQEEENFIDDDNDDPIIEVRRKVHVPIIDLTQSDVEEGEDGYEEDEDNSDDNDTDDDDSPAPPASPTGPATIDTTTTTTGTDPDPRAAQTSLLTPLPTILKSDRLGIGLKAKTEGPYRSSVKRVTHNAAALAAHIKASEDLRRTQRQLGRGRRAFARVERIEREKRQNMMAYLSGP
jgi:hypothetical protein